MLLQSELQVPKPQSSSGGVGCREDRDLVVLPVSDVVLCGKDGVSMLMLMLTMAAKLREWR